MPGKPKPLSVRSPAARPLVSSPYARTTISVPAPLKARMEAVGDQVNWSAVASQAFESRLLDLEQNVLPMTDMPNKDDALIRLRGLKNKPEWQLRQRSEHAYQLGKRWAMADAHPNELQRLEEFCQKHETNSPIDQWKIDLQDRKALKHVFRELTLKILGYDHTADIHLVRTEASAFWQRVGVTAELKRREPELLDAKFLSGFTQGALEFWTDVKEQL